MMKSLFNGLLMVLVSAGIFFTSCTEDSDLSSTVVENYVDGALYDIQERGGLGKLGCYELVFPVTLVLPDETTVTAEDYDTLGDALLEWKTNNPDATLDERPTFVFPVEVLDEAGEVISIADETELIALAKECGGGKFGKHSRKGHRGSGNCNSCFEVNYPVTIEFPDGTTADASDRDTLKELTREWKENNPDATERPSLVFPIEVTMTEDESVVTVNSQEELAELKESCRGN